MRCEKCNTGTMILVTSQNKKRTRERRGFIIWLVTLPVRLVKWFFNLFFNTQTEEYQKEQFWRCNYCGATKKQTFEPEHVMAQAEAGQSSGE